MLRGCALTDTQFTLDRQIWGEEISWNVTRIQRDAAAGVFGPPEVVPMKAMPPMTAEHAENIDWEKVQDLLFAHAPLDVPVLEVTFDHGCVLHRVPIDGNHRLVARQLLGMLDFRAFVVPVELERLYRITIEEQS